MFALLAVAGLALAAIALIALAAAPFVTLAGLAGFHLAAGAAFGLLGGRTGFPRFAGFTHVPAFSRLTGIPAFARSPRIAGAALAGGAGIRFRAAALCAVGCGFGRGFGLGLAAAGILTATLIAATLGLAAFAAAVRLRGGLGRRLSVGALLGSLRCGLGQPAGRLADTPLLDLLDLHGGLAGAVAGSGNGLLVQDLVDELLLGQALGPLDVQLFGNVAELLDEHVVQLQDIVHRCC